MWRLERQLGTLIPKVKAVYLSEESWPYVPKAVQTGHFFSSPSHTAVRRRTPAVRRSLLTMSVWL